MRIRGWEITHGWQIQQTLYVAWSSELWRWRHKRHSIPLGYCATFEYGPKTDSETTAFESICWLENSRHTFREFVDNLQFVVGAIGICDVEVQVDPELQRHRGECVATVVSICGSFRRFSGERCRAPAAVSRFAKWTAVFEVKNCLLFILAISTP
jgi:hypothetical protein